MFITRMVSGLICSKNSNKNANQHHQSQSQLHQHHHQQQQSSSKSPKSNKKAEKCKRSSLTKSDSKKSITDLLKNQVKETHSKETPCTSRAAATEASTSSACAFVTHSNTATLTTPPKPPTKVKSGSWKRSEKQISGYNTIANKKTKSLRKHSPTWLKFPNSPVKITEKVSYVNPNDSASVCRPGTLYSDVLFGAGSSCLVKIKTLTPRRNGNTAQKILTKALLKCTGNENDASGSDVEATSSTATTPTTTTTDHELFPSLNEFAKFSSVPGECAKTVHNNIAVTIPAGPLGLEVDTCLINSPNSTPTTTTASVKCDEEEADVVILSDVNDMQCNKLTENGIDNCSSSNSNSNKNQNISYGDYLQQHFTNQPQQQQLNGDDSVTAGTTVANDDILATKMTTTTTTTTAMATSPTKVVQKPIVKPFTIDIPQWNFLDVDISSDAYPKFLCQFDDEHYLKSEKMALLGLKLALGNNSQQGKFKF